MRFTADRPYADPEKAARELVEIANSIEAVQDGRIYIELVNWPFLSEHKESEANEASSRSEAIRRLVELGLKVKK
jgi:hypothetical protein